MTKAREIADVLDLVDNLEGDVTAINTALTGKAPTSHTHTIANVTSLQASLDAKAPTSHTHTIANVTSLQTSLDAKAPLASPALTGVPAAPTAGNTVSSTQIATTAHVSNAFAGLNAAAGYQRFKNGIVIQWGTHTSGAINVTTFVTFPLAFTTVLSVVVSDNLAYSRVANMVTTGFNTSSATGSSTVKWIAIGYIPPA